MIQKDFRQSHYIVYELELPYCSVCTSNQSDGLEWNTPVTCEESSDAIYKLYFTSNKAPLVQQPSPSIQGRSVLNSRVFRCITNATETTAKLKTGEGLASRSMMSIACEDFNGDPGPINFTDQGTFFGKLLARNVLEGKKIKGHYYSITESQNQAIEVYTTTHFIESVQLSDNVFTIRAKDALKDIEALTQQFPEPSKIELTADINNQVQTLPVNETIGLSVGGVIRIDEELMIITGIGSNSINVSARGSGINGVDAVVFKTRTDEHSDGSTVQKCYVMNNSFLPDVLKDILTFSGLGSFIDFAQWTEELSEWSRDAYLYGVYHTPENVDSLINSICSDYMIDMWLDQPSQKIKVGAISAWKLSEYQLYEGQDFNNLKSVINATERYSRAYIYNGKDYKTDNDDLTNFSRLTLATDEESEQPDFNGDIKLKTFDPSSIMTAESSVILVNRFIRRFSTSPRSLTFQMEERKLGNLKLGDVIDVFSRDKQSASGQIISAKDRAQIIKIQPNLNKIGRIYSVSAVTYVPELEDGDVIRITGSQLGGIDINALTGGNPNQIDITIVLDGALIGSPDNITPSITAGSMNPSSTIKIIFINGARLSAKGGDGGNAGNNSSGVAFAENGGNGGISYDSKGIQTDIYINYGTVDAYSTDGQCYAAGGGGGGACSVYYAPGLSFAGVSCGGGGGSGYPSSNGGNSTLLIPTGDFIGTPKTDEYQGPAGGFDFAGSGGLKMIESFVNQPPPLPPILLFILQSQSGAGGFSNNGINASTVGTVNGTSESSSIAGNAGPAFKGGNITVYNLAAESNKLRVGSSLPGDYTIINS